MLNNTRDARYRLREIGIRTPVDVVRQAVQRLKNGESVYALHNGRVRLLSKVTATKIAKLNNEGKLGFLLDSRPYIEAAENAISSANDAMGLVIPIGMLDPKGSRDQLTERILEIVPRLPQIDWNIEYLESVGIPSPEGLAILVEVDSFFEKMSQSPDRDAFARYVGHHYLVDFCRQENERKNSTPYELIKLASVTCAHGIIDNNQFLMKAGRGILSYQIWRGPQYIRAFDQAQVPTHRAVDQAKQQLMDKLQVFLKKNPTLDVPWTVGGQENTDD